MNILIIEDDLDLSLNIKYVFEKNILVNRVKIINSYINFINLSSDYNTFDIILVDIFLSDSLDFNKKNWLDLVKLIREKSKNIPIVVISWFNDIKYIDLAFKYWVNDYLVKPFRLEELRIRIFKWFNKYLCNTYVSDKKIIEYFWLIYYIDENNFYYNWEYIKLSKQNKYILSLFIFKAEILLSNDFLISKIWWDMDIIFDRNLRIYILRLKNTLKKYWISNWIINIRWEGYKLLNLNTSL